MVLSLSRVALYICGCALTWTGSIGNSCNCTVLRNIYAAGSSGWGEYCDGLQLINRGFTSTECHATCCDDQACTAWLHGSDGCYVGAASKCGVWSFRGSPGGGDVIGGVVSRASTTVVERRYMQNCEGLQTQPTQIAASATDIEQLQAFRQFVLRGPDMCKSACYADPSCTMWQYGSHGCSYGGNPSSCKDDSDWESRLLQGERVESSVCRWPTWLPDFGSVLKVGNFNVSALTLVVFFGLILCCVIGFLAFLYVQWRSSCKEFRARSLFAHFVEEEDEEQNKDEDVEDAKNRGESVEEPPAARPPMFNTVPTWVIPPREPTSPPGFAPSFTAARVGQPQRYTLLSQEPPVLTLETAKAQIRAEFQAMHMQGAEERRINMKRLLLQWHPDRNIANRQLATEAFQFIQVERARFRI